MLLLVKGFVQAFNWLHWLQSTCKNVSEMTLGRLYFEVVLITSYCMLLLNDLKTFIIISKLSSLVQFNLIAASITCFSETE